uniref:Peptide chain release factor 2 n=1 Tax=Buchnera aphidicola subsp. Baizongia pistaciae (strain Bp) TaxID=224915 RepID=RF2_BUCBP|nr:RecName: Full=Peptide chain release factor 2; Short=RF-2 [Buchnera aphidicola str. Bp (Baizongia pistaciae)]
MFKNNNIINDRITNLVSQINKLKRRLDYDIKKNRLLEINMELKLPETWKHPSLIKKINKEKNQLISVVTQITKIDNDVQELIDILNLENSNNINSILDNVLYEFKNIEKSIHELEKCSMFLGKYDYLSCYVDIQSGSGGVEAQDWASMLLRMYVRWAESKKFKIDIIEQTYGEVVGIKSATIEVLGKYAFGWFRTETGIHRLVRKSPFNAHHRRHTSFSSVYVYPILDDAINVDINTRDLKIDVYRASGAGGQHVNKTESAVRIRHLPTGIVVQCQNDRSQHKNKDQAMKQLKAKLYEQLINEKKCQQKILENNKLNIGWGHQIRSYTLDNSRIKDLRTGVESKNIQSVLDGGLDLFVECSLRNGL